MIVAGSAFEPESMVIAMPATKFVTLPTLMLVSPIDAAATSAGK